MFESAFLLGYLAALHVRVTGEDEPAPRSFASLYAEVRFLRAQLAMFVSRAVKPRRPTPLERIQLVFYSLFFDWSDALVVVKPATLIGWHRKLTALNWAFISGVFTRTRSGRPPIAGELRALILRLARENRVWSARDIAENLREKFGIVVSHRMVARYLRLARGESPSPSRGQSWSTFIRNHMSSTIACDFAVATTIAFKRLYVLVILELETRRILHVNVTAHPTASWTTQQFREALSPEHPYRFLIHDGDAIYSPGFKQSVRALGIESVRTPPRSPKANAFAERVIGTMRRGCLDHIIPMSEAHLRRMVREWRDYYNRSRPHMALRGRPPDPRGDPLPARGHQVPAAATIVTHPYLGGLHHDYRIAA